MLAAGELLLALRLAVALGRFWHVAGHLGERQRWLQRILDRNPAAPAALHAKALRLLGDSAWDTGNSTEAQRFYEESLTFAEDSGDPGRIAEALLGLGGVAAELQGDLTTAEERFTRSLALHKESGSRWGAALMRLNLADIALLRGDAERARALIEAALTSWQDLGYRQGVGRALYMLAELDEERGQTVEALPRYEESLAAWRAVHYRAGVAEAAASVGWLRLARGDYVEAVTLFAESLSIWREMASRRGLATSLENCAALAAARDRPQTALRLASAAAGLRESTGTRPSSLEQARLAPWLSDARHQLGRDATEVAWAAGAALPFESVLAEAAGVATALIGDHPGDALPTPVATYELTRREIEVLRLLARHLTDREIADALSISPRTIMHHVSHILAKLGVTSRRDAAAWAARHGLN
jgi:DNA-binding CsgD family transcriptional regulator/tetratricopeptide (TPR) repeat protein